MAKKRGNNEGTIYKRPDGKWCAQITTGRDSEGKLKRQTFYGKTRQEVAEKLSKAQNDFRSGMLVEPHKTTINDWLNTWLLEYKKISLRPSTFERYEGLIRLHITPFIGHYLLKDLRPEQLQMLYNERSNSGLSSSSVKQIHVILHESLKQALRNNLVPRNVSEATTIPKLTKKEIKILTLEEQKRFLNVLGSERLRAAFILTLATGVREGELLALTWDNVDLEEGIIKIKQSIRRIKNFDEEAETKTKIIFQEPKTKSGRRNIPIPESVLQEIKLHRKRQLQEKLLSSEIYQDNNLVFCSEIGTVIDPRNLLRKFYILLKKAELDRINFHALRHTYASRLLEVNEHPKVVQELLGHSDISMTLNTYSHVMPEVKKAAASKINSLFDDLENKSSLQKEGTND